MKVTGCFVAGLLTCVCLAGWGIAAPTNAPASKSTSGSQVTGASVPVPKTGQVARFVKGDDGYGRKGVAWPVPRFKDNGNGTVTDNLTGLMWTKNANLCGQYLWGMVLSNDIPKCAVGGYKDWRMPNRRELESLLYFQVATPALPDTMGTGKWKEGDPFTNVQFERDASFYWTSTTRIGSHGFAWCVDMREGITKYQDKAAACFIWPVRGP